jgi:ribosome biogenesis GTPase A
MPRTKKGGLGRALQKDRFRGARPAGSGGSDFGAASENTSARHAVEILAVPESGAKAGHSAKSMAASERSKGMATLAGAGESGRGVSDFLFEAELSNRQFEVERGETVIVGQREGGVVAPSAFASSVAGVNLYRGEAVAGIGSGAETAAGPKPGVSGAGAGAGAAAAPVSGVRFKLALPGGAVVTAPGAAAFAGPAKLALGPGPTDVWNEIEIPRRPAWDKTTTADELHRAEEMAFLDWRRGLAQIEETKGVLLTPYEKNINVWRQLWRVVERSDVLIQIVDARNPKLFRCPDVDQFVKEVAVRTDNKKANLLVCNKADLLSEHERDVWAEYFRKHDIDFVFFSASEEQLAKEIELNAELERRALEEEDASDSDSSDDDAAPESESKKSGGDDGENSDDDGGESSDDDEEDEEDDVIEPVNVVMNTASVLNREQLLALIQKKYQRLAEENRPATGETEGIPDTERLVVGFVGYPNVGKSSTINILMQGKLVSVAATPGKTKHFQTLLLDDDSIAYSTEDAVDDSGAAKAEDDKADVDAAADADTNSDGDDSTRRRGIHITLCDCPGLVFPTHLSTKSAMVCNGLLPIDHMREFRPPVELLVSWIPRRVLEDVYSLHLPVDAKLQEAKAADLAAQQKAGAYRVDTLPNATCAEFLKAYAALRGFRTVHGEPDESRAARVVLKDLLNGRLVFVHAPPGYPGGRFEVNHTTLDVEKQERNEKQRARQQELLRQLLSDNAPGSVAAAQLGTLDFAEAAARLHTPQRKTNMLKSPLDRAMHRKKQRMLKKGFTPEEVASVTIAGRGRKTQKGRKGKRRTDANASDFFQRQNDVSAFSQDRKADKDESEFTRAF